MRILMVGAGATGGYYGGMLAAASRDITFLVRGKRLEQLRANGLQIVTPEGESTVPVKTITAAELAAAGSFDLILLSMKAYSLEAAMDDFAPAVGPDTVILPILNGMRHIDLLSERFGREHVVGGSVTVVADMDDAGRIHRMTKLDNLNFGELDTQRTERTASLLPVLTAPGMTTSLVDDIVATLWGKWTMLSTMGAVGIVSGGTVGDVAAVPHGAETATAILNEATAIAKANGYPSPEKVYEASRSRMTEHGSTLTSSMFRDMTKGNPVEADHILGDFIARAKDVPVPLLTGAYVRLKVYEKGRK